MMDPIIRAVALAPTVRQLRRSSVAAVTEVVSTALDVPIKVAPVPAKEQIPMTQAFVAAYAPLDQSDELEQRREQELKQLQELREQTERKAYALGLEKGELAAKEAAAQHMQQLNTLIAELGKAKLLAARQAEDGIVAVVYETCCKILGAAALTKEGISAMVNQSLSAFQEEGSLIVRLHPQDLDALQATMPEVDVRNGLRWQEDATIALGGCVVEGASGTLDARLETQLDSLRQALLTARKNKKLTKGID